MLTLEMSWTNPTSFMPVFVLIDKLFIFFKLTIIRNSFHKTAAEVEDISPRVTLEKGANR